MFDYVRTRVGEPPGEEFDEWLESMFHVLLALSTLDRRTRERIERALPDRTMRALLYETPTTDDLLRSDLGTLEGVVAQDFEIFLGDSDPLEAVSWREKPASLRAKPASLRAFESKRPDDRVPEDFAAIVAWAKERGLEQRLADPIKPIGFPLPARILEVPRTIGDVLVVDRRSTSKVDQLLVAVRPLAIKYLEDCALRARMVDERAPAWAEIDALEPPPSLVELDRDIARLLTSGVEDRKGTYPRGEATFSGDPPAIRYVEVGPLRRAPASVCTLRLDRAKVVVTVSADDPAVRDRAIRGARRLLRDRRAPTHAALAEWAEVPRWARSLADYDQAMGQASANDAAPERLAIRIRVTPHAITADAVHVELGKSGKPRFSEYRNVSYTHLAEEDEPLGALLGRHHNGLASDVARTLRALVGHPRLYFEKTPVSLRRASLRIELRPAEGATAGALEVACTVDGRAVDLAALADSPGDGVALITDRVASGELSLVRLDRSTRAVLAALDAARAFPPESHAELFPRLERLAARSGIAVSLPEMALGPAIEPELQMVVRLDGARFPELEVAVRVRPLRSGPLLVPGAGEERVHASDGEGGFVHTRRSFAAELEALHALEEKLGLSLVEGACSVRDPEHVARVLAALRESSAIVEWAGPKPEVRTFKPAELKVQISRAREWFSIGGSIEIDGTSLALAQLLEAARSDRRYVAIGEKKFVELEAQLRAKLLALSDHARPHGKELELAPTAAHALADLEAAAVTFVAEPSYAETFARMLDRVRRASDHVPAVPAHLEGVLRPYQREGFAWASRLSSWGAGACLADDMGLGKTLQAIALLHARRSLGPALVVAPTSVVRNWLDELGRFGGDLRAILYRGKDRASALAGAKAGDVIVTSYDLAARDAESLSGLALSTLIVDEAQMVKNASTRRAQALRTIADGNPETVTLALTGTPIENHLGELWSILRLACPGLLGSWESFRARFAQPIEQHGDAEARASLARLIRPFVLRRTKEAVAPELPALTEIVHDVELGKEERAGYEVARRAAIEALESNAAVTKDDPTGRFAALAALTKLRRLACHPRLIDPKSKVASAKLTAFLELVHELMESGHQALVFSQFTGHLALVREALDAAKIGYRYLDGSTPAEAREVEVAAFQRGDAPLFLISLRAGGTGLNLTAANYVLHLDPWWNPAVEDQATDRAHRIGQTRPVTVIRLVARGTIEEAVVALHESKRALAEGLLEGTDAAARLTTGELVDLLRSSPDSLE